MTFNDLVETENIGLFRSRSCEKTHSLNFHILFTAVRMEDGIFDPVGAVRIALNESNFVAAQVIKYYKNR